MKRVKGAEIGAGGGGGHPRVRTRHCLSTNLERLRGRTVNFEGEQSQTGLEQVVGLHLAPQGTAADAQHPGGGLPVAPGLVQGFLND